ncbi:CIA30 family protein [Akkermansiaceae bacterium]|nr:CIA30 family protein [Akkermansiaceae bacterium]
MAIATACLTLTLVPGTAFAKPGSVAEFSPDESRKLGWQVVNDGVMGGLSKGKLSIGADGILSFSGNLSLENNGGFSSLRTNDVSLDLSDAKGLAARVKGDGRTYQIRLATDARFRGMEVSFSADFPTEKGKWTEVEIPFSDFTGSFRGMSLNNENSTPAKIRRLGILLGDKKAGAFEMQIDWIRTYGANKQEDGNSILSAAAKDGRFKTLAAAIQSAGLAETLSGDGPLTVFAPTDEAFAKLPQGTVGDLLKPENIDQLKAVITMHVTRGKAGLADALKSGSVKSLQGSPLNIAFAKGRVRVNDAAILDADLACGNGVIHVIDSVLLPPPPENDILAVAEKNGNFKTLIAAVKAAGLVDALSADGPITILAPTDEAFDRLPEGTVESLLQKENLGKLRSILTGHAIPGKVSAGDALNARKAKSISGQTINFAIKDGTLKANSSTILSTDIACDNGIIHIIDAVLLPEGNDKKSDAPASALKSIENAIDRGVPIYNSGDPAKCAAIYRECLMSLSKDKSLDARLREMLSTVAERGSRHDNAEDQAWLYRSALDKAYAIIGQD